MRLNTKIVGILVLMIIFGGYALADFLGMNDYFLGHGSGLGSESGSGRVISQDEPDGKELSATYDLSVEDIRGSFTLKDIATVFDIDSSVFAEAFDVEDVGVENIRLSAIHEIYGEFDEMEVGTSSVKLFVAYYKGADYEIDEEIYLPETAVEILLEQGKINETQKKYLLEHIYGQVQKESE